MTREEAIAMRLSCQQLVNPRFDSPEEVVDWMGMVQAQDYSHFRWAVGMRTRNPSLKARKRASRKAGYCACIFSDAPSRP